MTRITALGLATLLSLSACGDGGGDAPEGPSEELVAQVASFDLAVDAEQRFLVGLGLTGPRGNQFVSGGSVEISFAFLGEDGASGDPRPAGSATATFLPLPVERSTAMPAAPRAGSASEVGRGVYRVEQMAFDRPGFYEATVTASLPDGERSGTAAFQVLPEPRVPAVGQRALKTRNLTVEDPGDAPPGAIDSRAETEGEIPDPELHRATIAGAIRAGRPALVVFSTPVYCVSRFCGPITDEVAGLAEDYGDRADFIHVEVWRDFQNKVVNRAAARWILREDNLEEPWVFLIDRRGRIAARWDNVATRQEMEPWLERL